MPKVSVIIPNYNRAELIGLTLENILSQTLQSKEIIVVDDGSTDNSVDVIRSFGDQVTLICQTNQGPGAARNTGLKVATGDYIQFFDSDDLCSLNNLECQVNALEMSGADIAYCPWAKVYINSHQVRFENHVLQQKPLPNELEPLMWFLRGWFIVFQACLFRHSFIKKIGCYRIDLTTAEDSEFLLRMLLQNPQLQFNHQSFVLYRLHSMGQLTDSGTTVNSRLEDWIKFLLITKEALINQNIQVDNVTRIIFESNFFKNINLYRKLIVIEKQDTSKIDFYNYSSKILKTYSLINFWQRFTSGLRGRLTGSRYSYAYQVSAPIEYQYQLIRNLGYEILA